MEIAKLLAEMVERKKIDKLAKKIKEILYITTD